MYVLWRHFGITPSMADNEIPDWQLDTLLRGWANEQKGGE